MADVTFLVHLGKEYTVRGYLKSWAPGSGHRIGIRHYPGLAPTATAPAKRLRQSWSRYRFAAARPADAELARQDVIVFSDLDRLRDGERDQAVDLYDELGGNPAGPKLLNHPRRSLGRFELLDALYRQGSNRFAIYRLETHRTPARFPVFVRAESGHGGMSPLLHSQAELDRVLTELEGRHGTLEGFLMLEYCDVTGKDGVARKYGAFRVGDALIARHIHFSRDWAIRVPDIKTEHSAREELEYVRTNPLAEELMAVFRLAGVEYGRVDFGLLDGVPQIWEINTNPMILVPDDARDPLRFEAHDYFARDFARAFDTL